MEQFIITHIDGSTISLRQRSTVINVTRATQSVELLGNDVVDISVESAVKLYFQIGDKITIVGRDYTLNIPPKETKLSENKFRYDLQFEGVQYDLSRATYDVNIDTTGSDLYADALTGNMKLFLDVLIANINRVFPGKWVLGTYPDDTETKTLTFSETDNCLAVLQRLCEEYNQEFDIAIAQNGTRTINIEQAGKTIAFTFQYGKGKGIYELTREKVSSSNIVNRLKVYGGSKNISSKYRATRLCLPGKSKSQSYIENAESIAKYGVWENAIYFEDIFPQRTGIVTALGDTILKFIDNTMDFDLNEKEADGKTTKYLLTGTPAKIHFNTGNLAGYEFEITSYDHATKTFTIKSFKDERDMEFPSPTSAAFRFAAGDEYVLTDIAMPQSYIDAAEQKLFEKGQEYLSQNCQPKVQYSLTLDESFLKKTFGTEAESNIFWVGDYIPIKDSDIEVDKLIRVKGFTRDLLNEYSYNLTISDLAVTRSIYNRIISDLIDIDKIIQINDLANVAKARRNWLNAQEVLGMVFDVEGDYYTDKIKPQSIETMMLSVGAKSMQFVLVGTVFQPNYGGNKNRIVYKGGTLTHYAIVDENNNPRYWVLQDGDVTVTNDFQAYYIYAKCEKNGTGGTMLFSAQQIQAEQDANYYHFLIGVLNSVDSELQVRSISLTYGFTTINGKFIRTGRIESSDGITYFDLDNSKIGGKIRFVSTEGEEQDMGEWADDTESLISQVDAAVTNLNTYVNGAFKDGLIDEAEAKAIAEHLKTLSKEKANIDNEYSVIYNNSLLSGTPKTNLESAKTDLDSKYTALVNAINAAIEDGSITDVERINVNTGFTNYANSLKIFTQRIDEALNAIALQQSINTSADAYAQLADISDDDKLTPNDKQTTKKEWDIIVSEKPTIEAQAATYGITTEKTNYVNAYNALNTYITPLLSSLTTTSNIVGTTFREKIKTYYDAKTSLLKVITDGAKTIADNAQSDASDALAKANTSKAITDKFGTTTDGGLINTVITELREADSEIVTAGISGIQGTNKDYPAFWAGGTYAQALAGTAKSIDRHDGSGHRAGGRIKWDKDGKTTLHDVIVKGSSRSPFEYCPDSTSIDYSDNVVMLSDVEHGWLNPYSLPWDLSQSGRRITIANYKWGETIAVGSNFINAPSGKYFFEDGVNKSRLYMRTQVVELLGYGDDTTFYGWIVLSRKNLFNPNFETGLGSPINFIAYGTVYGNNTGATMSAKTFDGYYPSVSRLGEGRYKITINPSWFSSSFNIIIMATGLGYSYGASTPVKATVTERTTTYFVVDTSDDDSRNDGSFMFLIMNYNDWLPIQ